MTRFLKPGAAGLPRCFRSSVWMPVFSSVHRINSPCWYRTGAFRYNRLTFQLQFLKLRTQGRRSAFTTGPSGVGVPPPPECVGWCCGFAESPVPELGKTKPDPFDTSAFFISRTSAIKLKITQLSFRMATDMAHGEAARVCEKIHYLMVIKLNLGADVSLPLRISMRGIIRDSESIF
jgi:hypothetical protein